MVRDVDAEYCYFPRAFVPSSLRPFVSLVDVPVHVSRLPRRKIGKLAEFARGRSHILPVASCSLCAGL